MSNKNNDNNDKNTNTQNEWMNEWMYMRFAFIYLYYNTEKNESLNISDYTLDRYRPMFESKGLWA